ncbi:SRPBCC family protein [Puia sp. P3]|uniref:SRPBCC family protein n=1 Tax=Puia sp. P3 TaxID=3423952 RepID=UPI003D66A20F
MARPVQKDLGDPIQPAGQRIIHDKKQQKMNPRLQFDFTVNKEKNTIDVQREFAADLDLVWDAWTKPELLDLWWAPKPYQTRTKSMDFREGGFWLYAMISPRVSSTGAGPTTKRSNPKATFQDWTPFATSREPSIPLSRDHYGTSRSRRPAGRPPR